MTHQLVQQTILQFTVIVGLVFALSWGFMAALVGAAPQAARLFVLANVAVVVGVVLAGLRTPAPNFWCYQMADWALVGGFASLHRGLLYLIDADRPPLLHSLMPLLMAVLTTAFFEPDPSSFTVMGLALFGTTAWYAFTAFMDGMRGLDRELFSAVARFSISVPFLLMGLVLVGRTLEVLAVAIFGVQLATTGQNPVVFLWAMVCFMLLANIALAALATGRLVMRIQALAEMDYLTGCLNRRSLEQRMQIEFDRSNRSGEPLACVFFDLDHFKQINDIHGHAAGDAALKHTVRLISDLLRNVDALGRYGGEEFMVLMPNTTLQGAKDAANRMRLALTRSPLDVKDTKLALSASFGAAILGRQETSDNLMRRADAAMYDAKRLGRNRVEVSEANN